jgi:hypothetical protein
MFSMARFDSANAREMAAKSHAARRGRKSMRETPPQSPQADPQIDGYVGERLAHAREEIKRLCDLLAATKGAQDCERLSRAIACWSEIERKLAGRPDPGTYRPTQRRQTGRAGWASVEPL